jgi:hypothetical protein
LVLFILLRLALPAFSQRRSMQARINQSVDHHEPQLSQITPSTALDLRTARLRALQQDANELSSLSASVRSDLQKVQKGSAGRGSQREPEKMEKLSKKVRREIE